MSDIISTNYTEVPAMADDNLVAMARTAEARVDAINRIKRAALRVTNANDWTDQNGKPYLQVSGDEKIARLYGVSWRIDEPELLVEEDGHFNYTFKGYFRIGAAEIEAEGSRGSRDGFFSHGGKLTPSEVDRRDVRMAAYTNCLGNGITRLLGIRNLTWDDLAEAGITREGVNRIDYTPQEMSGEAKSQRDEIWSMLMEMSGRDAELAKKGLAKYTSFTAKDGKEVPGKTDIDKLREKAVPPTYERIKKAHDEWLDKQDKPEIIYCQGADCEGKNKALTTAQATTSMQKFGKNLCIACQKKEQEYRELIAAEGNNE